MTQSSIALTFTRQKELPTKELGKLSRLEIARSGEFRSPNRQQEYLCGRALLRTVLEQFTGEPASSHEITTDGKGKPFCVDGPAISLAHSGDLVVCAVTDQGQIGVDVEIPDRRRNTARIANEYFAADEARWLSSQPADRFYMLWVLKESWLKAEGTGIAGGLDRLRCVVRPPKIEARISDDATPKLSLHRIDSAFIGVATTTALQNNLIIECWDPVTGRIDEFNNAELIATSV